VSIIKTQHKPLNAIVLSSLHKWYMDITLKHLVTLNSLGHFRFMVLGDLRDGSLVNLYLVSLACGLPTKRQLPNSCKWDCACTSMRAYWGLALHCPPAGEEIWLSGFLGFSHMRRRCLQHHEGSLWHNTSDGVGEGVHMAYCQQ